MNSSEKKNLKPFDRTVLEWLFLTTSAVIYLKWIIFLTVQLGLSYNKKNHFSGNVIGRMTILSDLHVHHPLSKVKQPKHSKEGRITNILHFRWLAAMVIKKCFQDYEGILSKSFTLGFSEIFIHLEGQSITCFNITILYFTMIKKKYIYIRWSMRIRICRNKISTHF